ncbi:unnamed protein product [Pleuronectes platessa]|uniref:Uncharacterized protein n=1 Tax=Pleuronectes platessa TaxID=8262 RepID=A0A9N7U0T0_PLEPL|nr:unnamed protein product [Pleuronectes platessa]
MVLQDQSKQHNVRVSDRKTKQETTHARPARGVVHHSCNVSIPHHFSASSSCGFLSWLSTEASLHFFQIITLSHIHLCSPSSSVFDLSCFPPFTILLCLPFVPTSSGTMRVQRLRISCSGGLWSVSPTEGSL